MGEGEAWRSAITKWVAMLCVAAILCCWIMRPLRYAYRPDTPLTFDKRTGDYSRSSYFDSPEYKAATQ
jgi:hypothetical protein